MEPFANVDCVLKVNQHCDACKRKMMEVLSSIVGVYSVRMDACRGLVKISGEVDPNMLLNAISKTGKHAEVVFTKLKHPQVTRSRSRSRSRSRTPHAGYTSYNYSPNYISGGYNDHNYGAIDHQDPYHCYRTRPSPHHPQDTYHRPYYPENPPLYNNQDYFPPGRYVPSYPPRDNNPFVYNNQDDFPPGRYAPSYPPRDNNPFVYNNQDFPPDRYVPSYPPRDYNPYEDESINLCSIM